MLEKGEPDAPGGKKLLAARLVSLQGSGWEVFAITQAVSCFTPGLGGTAGTLGVCGQELFLTHFTRSGLSASSTISYLQSLQQRGGAQALGGGVRALPRAPGGSILPQTGPTAPQVTPVLAPAAMSPVPQPRSRTSPPRGWETSVATGVPVHSAPLLTGHWVCWAGTCRGDTGAVPVLACGDTGLLPQVRDWTEDESSNQGLLVTVQGLGGSPLDPPPLQFASGRDHHESKKPMLVLFTDDGRRGASLPMAGFPGGSHAPWHGSLSATVPSPVGRWGPPRAGAPSNPKLLLWPRGRGRLLSGLVCAAVQARRCKSGFCLL